MYYLSDLFPVSLAAVKDKYPVLTLTPGLRLEHYLSGLEITDQLLLTGTGIKPGCADKLGLYLTAVNPYLASVGRINKCVIVTPCGRYTAEEEIIV